jgi:hypothetical protein
VRGIPQIVLCLVLLISQAQAEGSLDGGAAPDAGESGGPLMTLFLDYGCPEAPPMVQVDGGWIASDARKARIDCGLAGANVEVHSWRDKEAARASPSFQLLPSHGVIAILGALVTGEIAVIKSRASQGCRAVANPFANTCH